MKKIDFKAIVVGMKVNRFKNVYFWMAVGGFLYLILSDLGIMPISEERFDQYVQLIAAIMIVSGIWVDPTTPGFVDANQNGIPDDQENFQ